MPTITLLRHGQASFGAADYDELSDLGHRQAALAGRVLADRGLRRPIITSGTLRRQVDTAAAVSRAIEAADTRPTDSRWNEYDHVGMVTEHADANSADVQTDPAAFQRILDRALAEWVHADTAAGWQAFSGGAIAALRDLAADLVSGQDAVVATSGGVIAAVCGHLLGLGADGVVALNRVTVNAGLTTILVGASGASLLSFNDHAHFTGAAVNLRTYR